MLFNCLLIRDALFAWLVHLSGRVNERVNKRRVLAYLSQVLAVTCPFLIGQ